MDGSDGVADLHLHTTASDGTCPVDTRIDQAADQGLGAIAITDHDCIAADLTHRVESVRGIELISGVEVRGDVAGTKVELLSYYVDPEKVVLQSVLEQARSYRKDRNRVMVETLSEVTDHGFNYDRLASEVDGMLGRPHMAEALVKAGTVESIAEAFDRFLGADGAAFVPMERVPAPELIDAIHQAAGVAVLAHPGRVRSKDIRGLLTTLIGAGLDGIEVWYPYTDAPQSSDYADVGVQEASALASEHGLLRTGGSDCHGPGSGKFRIGEVRTPKLDLDSLRQQAEDRSAL